MNRYMQLEDIYSAIDYYKIFFNKIKQGLGSLASDLDIMKACKVIQIPGMIISKWEIYNEPCVLVTNVRAWKAVIMTQ